MLGDIIDIAGKVIGGGKSPADVANEAQKQALADQAELLNIQAKYQRDKAALDLVSNLLNSSHQSTEEIANKIGRS
jgi:hypothetical protein